MSTPFTAAGFWRGVRHATPLGVSIFVYGLAFGMVAGQAMFSVGEAVSTSAAIYSGSAQLAAVSLIQTGTATLASLAVTIMIVNARYVLFGAALQPWLRQTTTLRAFGSLLLLGDANWILVMKAIDAGEQDRAYLAGTGAPMFVGWLVGTALGVGSIGVLPAPEVLGIDLILPCFAAAMMAAMMKTRASLVPVAVGATVALGVSSVAGASWAIISAGVAGGVVAAFLWRPAGQP